VRGIENAGGNIDMLHRGSIDMLHRGSSFSALAVHHLLLKASRVHMGEAEP
jgi:hypothetical protein